MPSVETLEEPSFRQSWAAKVWFFHIAMANAEIAMRLVSGNPAGWARVHHDLSIKMARIRREIDDHLY